MLLWLFIFLPSQLVDQANWLGFSSFWQMPFQKSAWGDVGNLARVLESDTDVWLMRKHERSIYCFLPQCLHWLAGARLFPEVTTCWLASISAAACEALAVEAVPIWKPVQRLECKCWTDAEMLRLWPKSASLCTLREYLAFEFARVGLWFG